MQYCPMPKESIDANYQVVEVSFDLTLLRHNLKNLETKSQKIENLTIL